MLMLLLPVLSLCRHLGIYASDSGNQGEKSDPIPHTFDGFLDYLRMYRNAFLITDAS